MSHPDCSVASAELRSRGGTLSTISDCIAGWSIPKPSPLRTPDAMNSRRISAVARMNMPAATTSNPGTITAPLPRLSEIVPEIASAIIEVIEYMVKYRPGLPKLRSSASCGRNVETGAVVIVYVTNTSVGNSALSVDQRHLIALRPWLNRQVYARRRHTHRGDAPHEAERRREDERALEAVVLQHPIRHRRRVQARR